MFTPSLFSLRRRPATAGPRPRPSDAASSGRAPTAGPRSAAPSGDGTQNPCGLRPAKAMKLSPHTSLDSLVAEERANAAPFPLSVPPSFGSGSKGQPRRPLQGARLPRLGGPLSVVPRTYAPAPVIRITYRVDPIGFAPGGPPLPLGPGPVQPMPAPAISATAEELRGAARAVSNSEPVLSHNDLVAAAAAGKVIPQRSLQRRRHLAEMAKLVAVLPIQAIAHMCATNVASLVGMGSERLAQHVYSTL